MKDNNHLTVTKHVESASFKRVSPYTASLFFAASLRSVHVPLSFGSKMKLIVYVVVAMLYRANAFDINTVTSLNVTKYLGRWYQVRFNSPRGLASPTTNSRECTAPRDEQGVQISFVR